MKNLKLALPILFVILALGGCYFATDSGSSSVGIELPDPRSVAGPDEEPAELARIYVINGPSLVSVGDGTPYKEITFDLTDGERVTEVSVGPVPSGDGYEVVVVFGGNDSGTEGQDVFIPFYYGATAEPLSVYGGQATETPELEIVQTPFAPVDIEQTLGEDLLGIVVAGTRVYSATSDQLFESDPIVAIDSSIDFPPEGVISVPSGYTVNSITHGADRTALAVPWLNTNDGILPYINGASPPFRTSFDNREDVTGYNPTEKDMNVLDSGAFVLGSTDPEFDGDVFAYFQFDGGLGGVWDDSGTLKWMNPARFDELVTGQPILDLDVQFADEINAFVASKLGAFKMPQALLTEEPPTGMSPAQRVLDESTFFEVEIDGAPAQITDLSIANGDYLYIGTPRGAGRVLLSQIGSVSPPNKVEMTMVTGSEGLPVVDLISAEDMVVVLTEHYLIYSMNAGSSFRRLPTYASSVGTVSGMFVTPTGAVLVSGSEGLVGVDLAAIP